MTITDPFVLALNTSVNSGQAPSTPDLPFPEEIDRKFTNLSRSIAEALDTTGPGDEMAQGVLLVVGQYRDTAVSGRRNKEDFTLRLDGGHTKEHRVLMQLYWQLFPLSNSFGELFAHAVEPIVGNIKKDSDILLWHSLNVYLEEAKFSYWHNQPQNSPVGLDLELGIPRRWLDVLFPDRLFQRLREIIEKLASGAELSWEELELGVKRELATGGDACSFEAQLSYFRQHFCAAVLGGGADCVGVGSADVIAALIDCTARLQGVETPAELLPARLTQLIEAIQLMGMYWRWFEKDTAVQQPGELVVCLPTAVGPSYGLMPRFAVSMMIKQPAERRRAVEHCKCRLDRGLQPLFRETNRQWGTYGELMRRYVNIRHISKALLDRVNNWNLRDELLKSRSLNACDVEALLAHLLPVADEMSSLVNTFVHEGYRYTVNVILGTKYHEQMIGERLADLTSHKTRLATQTGLRNGITASDVLKDVTKGTYSILDSEDVAVFGAYSTIDATVGWKSVLRLNDWTRVPGTSGRFSDLTRTYSGLFVLSATRNGKVRVYGAGRPLMEYSNTEWFRGSDYNDLVNMLASRFKEQLQLHADSEQQDKDSLRELAALLYRISETPHVGALIVFAEAKEIRKFCGALDFPPEDLWLKKSPETLTRDKTDLLYKLCIMDGATVVEIEKPNGSMGFGEAWKGANVLPRQIVSAPVKLSEWRRQIYPADLLQCREYGSRRASALALAMNVDQAVCVVVSADGPIYIMSRGGHKMNIDRFPKGE